MVELVIFDWEGTLHKDGVLCPHAIEFLRLWHARIPLCIASGLSQSKLEEATLYHGIAHFFVAICGTPPNKRTIVQTLIRQHEASSLTTLLVGDSAADEELAEKIGTQFYGIGQGMAGSRNPHHIDLSKLGEWILTEL